VILETLDSRVQQDQWAGMDRLDNQVNQVSRVQRVRWVNQAALVSKGSQVHQDLLVQQATLETRVRRVILASRARPVCLESLEQKVHLVCRVSSVHPANQDLQVVKVMLVKLDYQAQ